MICFFKGRLVRLKNNSYANYRAVVGLLFHTIRKARQCIDQRQFRLFPMQPASHPGCMAAARHLFRAFHMIIKVEIDCRCMRLSRRYLHNLANKRLVIAT